MSLLKQLFLAICLLIVIAFTGSFLAGVESSREQAISQLRSHAQDAATALGLSMSPHVDDPAMIELMVSSIFDSGYFQTIRVVNIADESIIVERKNDNISKEQKYDRMKKKVLEDVRKVFKPEFINRLDEIIVFQTLDMEEMKKIVGLMVKRVTREVETAGYVLVASEEAKELLAKEGFDPQYGARPLRRAIQRLIEDPLAEEFIRNTPAEGSTIYVDVKEVELKEGETRKEGEEPKKELTFNVKPPEKKPEPPAEEQAEEKSERDSAESDSESEAKE